jgi:hypothetical protein
MSKSSAMPPLPPLRNNDEASEHYADASAGVNFLNGNLRITFVAFRADHSVQPASQYRQVTLRLIMPLSGAADLQRQVASLISLLQRQGAIQPILAAPQTKQ